MFLTYTVLLLSHMMSDLILNTCAQLSCLYPDEGFLYVTPKGLGPFHDCHFLLLHLNLQSGRIPLFFFKDHGLL